MTTATLIATPATFAEAAALDVAVAHATQAGADARLVSPLSRESLAIMRDRYADAIAARKVADRTDRTPGRCTVLGTASAAKRRRQAKYAVTQYTTYQESDYGPHQEGVSGMPMTLGEVVALLGSDWEEEDGFFQGPVEQEWNDETGRLESEYRKGLRISRLDGAELSEARERKIKELAWMDV